MNTEIAILQKVCMHIDMNSENSKNLLTERRHIHIVEIHFTTYQWLMTCIKGLEMSKIVNEPLSPSINQIAHMNFARIFFEKRFLIIVNVRERITEGTRVSTEGYSQFLTSYRFENIQFAIRLTSQM